MARQDQMTEGRLLPRDKEAEPEAGLSQQDFALTPAPGPRLLSPGGPPRSLGWRWGRGNRPRWNRSESSQGMNFPTAFILSSMEKISNLEPPILYVFPFPKPSKHNSHK